MAPPLSIGAERVPSGCLEWRGALTADGYGKCGRRVEGVKYHLAHRWAWAVVHGPIPKGMLVCHTCDNPPCIEVSHLFVGTDEDNARDRARKGRNGIRNRHMPRKMTRNQVMSAVLEYCAGGKQRDIADKYGVSQTAIHYHVKREQANR